MKDVVFSASAPLFAQLPGGTVTGIALPCSAQLGTGDRFDSSHPLTKEAMYRFTLTDKVVAYNKRYGSHVFYLGTYQNSGKGIFKLFSFPVRFGYGQELDLTTICKSCEDLCALVSRYGVNATLIPAFCLDGDVAEFNAVYRPMMDLILDDKYLLINYRRG